MRWGIKDIVSILIFRTSNHYLLIYLRFQFLSLIERNSIKILSAKNPEMRNICLVTTPSLKWSFILKLFVWDSILKICSSVYGFIPYIRRQILILHHACSHLPERFVLALCNTILLWCVGHRMLHKDATFLTEMLKVIVEILLSIFSPSNILYLISTHVLN